MFNPRRSRPCARQTASSSGTCCGNGGRAHVRKIPVRVNPVPKNTNPQIPVKTSNPGRNPS